MAYNEYIDTFLCSQSTGAYHMIVFDIVNSKSINPSERKIIQRKLIELMRLVFNYLSNLEKITGKDILIKDQNFYRLWEQKEGNVGYLMDPILFGDCLGFTIYRDSLDKDSVIEIFNRYKEQLGINVDFHIADGYYETNDYSLGKEKCFRGYCFQILETAHKRETETALKKM